MTLGRHLSLLFVALLTSGGSAQYIIDLSAEKLDLPDCGVMVDSVFTPFDGTAPIGSVMKGIGNASRTAFLLPSVGTALNNILQRNLPTDSVRRHVFLKVDVLRVQETTMSTSEIASCGMGVEFIGLDTTGYHRLFYFGVSLVDRGMDATHYHARHISIALEQAFTAFMKADREGQLTHVPLPDGWRTEPGDPTHMGSPVMSSADVPNGIFPTFMDLLHLTPDSTIQFDLKERLSSTATVRDVKMDTHGAGYEHSAWGCASDGRWYVNTGRNFVQLQRDAEGFHTYLTVNTTDPEDVLFSGLVGGVLFGAIGGGLGVAAAQHSETIRFDLDLLTGQLIPSEPHGDDPSRSEPERGEYLFCYSTHCKLDTNVCVTVFGEQAACLRRGRFFSLKLLPRLEAVPVELRMGDGTRVPVMVQAVAADKQVYLIKVNGDGELKVDELNDEMSRAVLEDLRPEDEVK